jgi:hypothetical protein
LRCARTPTQRRGAKKHGVGGDCEQRARFASGDPAASAILQQKLPVLVLLLALVLDKSRNHSADVPIKKA